MNNLTLGLDLGTNSIGWAIRDISVPNNQIIKTGVLIFDKGVGEEKGIEFPKVRKRTESRGKRRNYQAEKYRKWELLEFLVKKNMCPLSIGELDEWRKYRKGQKRKYPQSERFINWLRFDFNGDGKPDYHLFNGDINENHYLFRMKAVSENENDKQIFKENPEILGRVFYHLVQRRGFKGRDEEEAKTMLEGSPKNDTPGRNEISKYIDEYGSLGAALYHYQKIESTPEYKIRIRQRYNLRKDYEKELIEICRIHNLDSNFYHNLWKAIIWQRPLRTQKGLVGMCTYEKNKRRAPISHPLYEEYQTWVFINNLRIEAPEGQNNENYLKENIYPIFYKTGNDFKLKSILDQLKKDGANIYSNYENRPDTKVLSAKLLRQFEDILGENWKEEYHWEASFIRNAQPQKKSTNEYTVEDIWHVLYTFDSEEKLKEFAQEKLELSEEKAEKFSKIRLQQGYATLSLSAIKKILPYLKKGILYSNAVYLANIQKVLGTHEVSQEFIDKFAQELDTIFEQINIQRKLNNILNSLFREELIAKDAYFLNDNQDLTETDRELILQKTIDIWGEKSWNEMDNVLKEELLSQITNDYRDFLRKSLGVRKGAFLETPRIHQKIFDYLEKHYHVPKENIKHLWHPSEQEKYDNASEFHQVIHSNKELFLKESELYKYIEKYQEADTTGISMRLLGNPEPRSKGFKNPMALKTLYKLKHLLNFLLITGQIDEQTRIVIEIARELNNANYRKAMEKWQNDRERENEKFKKTIVEINEENGTNFNPEDKNLIRKIRLWEEQGRRCMYTGQTINKSNVLNGEYFDLEHTIPASLSFDNELKNLTLANKYYNSNIKGKRLPTQLNNYNDTSTFNGETIQPILKNIEAIFGKRTVETKTIKKRGKEESKIIVKWSKIADLENQLDEYLKRTRYASSKEIKDDYIQKRHLINFELDYLKRKLHTFTIEEFKAGWRNSQIRDTQIMTKYAVPYIKTVFNRVEVQKGNVVNIFKEVYDVKLSGEKKDRTKHTHHAIDAAILTLIPTAAYRDKIIEKYQLEIDNRTGKTYHEKPLDWNDFKTAYIKEIEEQTLINNLKDHRTLTPTIKRVRKRGKIQYKENGESIWATGDTIRGQLHGESLYGAIKQPLRNDENKIIFENGKMKLEEDIRLVIRKPLLYAKDVSSPGFKNLAELESSIVDSALFKIIEGQVNEVGSFKEALEKGIYMLNKKGEKINKIRHVRCFDRLNYSTAIRPHEHSFISNKEYKRTTYAINGENVFGLLYKGEIKGKEERALKIIGIYDLAELQIKDESEFFGIPLFNTLKKNKSELSLNSILKSGQKVLFYKDNKEELKDLTKKELSNRLYKMYQFESDGRIKLKHHLISGSNTDIKKEYKEASSYDFQEYRPLLRITSKGWNFAIENTDFKMDLDGSISWKF